MKVKVAAIQFAPEFKKYEDNMAKIEDLLKSAFEKGSQLAVLPEMCTTGYIFDNRDDIRDYVETVPGRTTDRLCVLAKLYNMHIIIGLAEKDEDDIFYNTAALIGPEGYIGKYRKIHQFIADPLWSADGDLGFEVFDTKIGKIGMCICFDMNVEETCAVLDRKDCEIFCAPSNWFGEKPMSPVWITRAFEFEKPMVVSNRTGKERTTVFDGISCIIDKQGNILDSTDSIEGIAIAEVDVVQVEPRVKKDFYKDLSRHSYGWNPNWFFRQTSRKLPIGDDFQAAVVQIKKSDCGMFSENKKMIKKMIVDDLNSNTKVVVFPEGILNGIDKEIHYDDVVSFASELCPILSNYDGYVALSGIIEEAGKISSRIFLIGKNGIAAQYKRIYSGEGIIDDYGTKPEFIDTEYGRISMMFGDELINMEPARCMALDAVDMLLIPEKDGNAYNRYYDKFDLLWSLAGVRARENNMYILYANYIGGNSAGFSGIFGPDAFVRPDDFVYSDRLEGSVRMMIYLRENSRVFPMNRVKYKPLLRFRKPNFYRALF
ncbi:MAG: hypothetical protein KMY55_02285 [Dethiosulfatibacter sp.]|nr:hypothetical protein [Dethiosulfatibacter sp.]